LLRARGAACAQLGSPMQTDARLQVYHQLFDGTHVEQAEHLLDRAQAIHERTLPADKAGLARILLARAKLAEIEFGKYKRNMPRSIELHQVRVRVAAAYQPNVTECVRAFPFDRHTVPVDRLVQCEHGMEMGSGDCSVRWSCFARSWARRIRRYL
jgi:hypothetical protein